MTSASVTNISSGCAAGHTLSAFGPSVDSAPHSFSATATQPRRSALLEDGFRLPGGTSLPDDEFLRQCIHCGMCLPTCPTYRLTLREISSPRGRIRMMKHVAEGRLQLSEIFMREMFFCLDCRACETACPAGVHYGALVERARAQVLEARKQSGTASRLQAIALGQIFTKPWRLRQLARAMRWLQRSGLFDLALRLRCPLRLSALGSKLLELAPLAPRIERKFTFARLPEHLPSFGPTRHRVGMLVGCVQDVAFASVNEDTAEVLRHNGCEVVVPRGQVCCGSLHGHSGDINRARMLARINMQVFEETQADALVVNAAGCGAFMKGYDHLFADEPEMRHRAEKFSRKVKDFSEFLVESGCANLRPLRLPRRTTYHDACHLAHGQKIVQPPRTLLRAILGEHYTELPEADWCCGSAGIYSITHFETAMQLLDRKMENVRRTGARCCVTANPGCMIQLQHGARRAGVEVEVLHLATLLRRGYEDGVTS